MAHFSFVAALAAATLAGAATAASAAEERRYCTQHGPFMMRFDGDQAAGFFAIRANDDIGAVVGALNGRDFFGNWYEADSEGKIRISFSDDWSRFDAAYSIAPKLDDWISGWIGYLPPAGAGREFAVEDETFLCD